LTADRADHLTESIKVSAGTLKVVTCFDDVKHSIESLRLIQPSLPVLVTVYTAGAVTRWGEPHSQATSLDTFRQTVGSVLQANASINIYGFAGGTNFGFYNGALDNFDSHSVAVDGSQVGAKRMHQHRAHRAKVHGARAGKQFKTVGIGLAYRPVTTSYNYDAAVSETGCVQQSPKYHSFRRLLLDHNLISRLHVVPQNPPDVSLGVVKLDQRLSWQTLVSDRSLLEPPIVLSSPVFMERLNVQYGNGQGYGWILYRTVISGGLHYINVTGILRDRALIYLDSKLVSTVYSDKVGDFSVVLTLHSPPTTGAHGHVLEILVENMGRANFGLLDEQRKGFVGRVLTDGGNSLVDLQWEHFSLDFSQNFIDLVRHAKHSWTTWNKLLAGNSQQQPTLYRGQFKVRQPKDSFLDMSKWTKGLVILNGFILGRYWNIGPQYVLYVPAPLLARGVNDLIVFELERTVNGKVKFVSRPEHHHVMHAKKQV
jgi:beta-galactosidase